MGSFAGHLLPGLIFVFQSIKWLYYVCRRDIVSSDRETSRSRYSSDKRSHRMDKNMYHEKRTFIGRTRTPQPSDSLHIIILTVIGVIAEFITGFENGRFTHYGNLQHITMYASFMMASVASLLCHYESPGVPEGLDYLTFALALFIEGLLFTFHLHGRTALDVTVHQFLVILLVMSFAIVLIEWHLTNKMLPSIMRIYLTLLQGTWFIQVGFILYNPLPGAKVWADHDHQQIMIVTCIFCLHILFDFIVVFGVYIFTSADDLNTCSTSVSSSPSYRQLPTNDVES